MFNVIIFLRDFLRIQDIKKQMASLTLALGPQMLRQYSAITRHGNTYCCLQNYCPDTTTVGNLLL